MTRAELIVLRKLRRGPALIENVTVIAKAAHYLKLKRFIRVIDHRTFEITPKGLTELEKYDAKS